MEIIVQTLIIAAVWSIGYILGCYFTVRDTTRTIKELGNKWLQLQQDKDPKPF